jgi:hypothetical protein
MRFRRALTRRGLLERDDTQAMGTRDHGEFQIIESVETYRPRPAG